MQNKSKGWTVSLFLGMFALLSVQNGASAQAIPGTRLLEATGDIASDLVAGVDEFLLRKLNESVGKRESFWKRDVSSAVAYNASIASNRQRLERILGIRDDRVPFSSPRLLSTIEESGQIGQGAGFRIYRVRWPAFGDVSAEGLLLEPDTVRSSGQREAAPKISIIALPDADQTPEQLVGLSEGIARQSQFARRLAENGCRVLIPSLVSRSMERRHSPGRNGGANLTHREFLYRPAFELGRHIVGYEVQKVLAGIDWFSRRENQDSMIGIIGYGEGGMVALYAAALDTRVDSVCVSGYFEGRERIWEQPISRNVFGLLEEFGDAELAAMVAPRSLIVEASRGPELKLPGEGGAPAVLISPTPESARLELKRAHSLIEGLDSLARLQLLEPPSGMFGAESTLMAMLESLGFNLPMAADGNEVTGQYSRSSEIERMERLVHEIDRHNQRLLVESPYVRKEFMKGLDTSSVSKFESSAARYREIFYDDVIGRFDEPLLPPNVRSRQVYDEENWIGYELVLDVFPSVIAYGILCVPKDIADGERRPVVVCQHGLEGRPQMIISGDHGAYHDFASKLAERGFITFSPQNLYLFEDRFRTLQRKANPLKKTLFSIIVPQHQQIVNWLKVQSFVDPDRIGFYGLSYGGKTAMRVPSIVTDYCLSICSADFNEWVWKNASTRSPYSYVWTGEYEIFEFDLGSTFNYAEMASLIAPRPFMVERGHFDGVAPDETVGYEFAKVRHLYAAKLGLADRCEIEWFSGPHTINGKASYDFLHKHLNWPKP